MSEKFGYIYITTNTVNNMKYIGQHKSMDFNPHYKGSGIRLREALKIFGSDKFTVELLEWCENQLQLDEREQYWINYYNASKNNNFYNVSLGGSGGKSFYYGEFSKEHRQHLSESLKGKTSWNKGLTVEDERVRKHAYTFKGKHHTEEAKKIMSEKHLKKNLSKETIMKMSKSQYDWYNRKGTCFWINDGITEHTVNECEYIELLKNNSNIKKGRLPDYIYMTNNQTTVKIHKSQTLEYLSKGYYLGKSKTIGNNISKSRRHIDWYYKDMQFGSSKELTAHLRSHGYPNISCSTVTNISRGNIVKSYKELTGLIIRRSKEDTNEN